MKKTGFIRPAWTPVTIALMILGFIIFWPLGLAMIAYIIWGDRLEEFKSEVNRATDGVVDRFRGSETVSGFSGAGTGNVAFDEWRKGEFERLAEERRKLDEMRAEFDEYQRELRRAKDREEFDSFLSARKEQQKRDAVTHDGEVSPVTA